MRKVKFVSVFTLIALLLLSISQTVGLAQVPQQVSPSPTLLDLDGPVSKWTDADLERLVDLIVNEKITVPQSQNIAEQLTKEQLTKVGELLAVRAGVPMEEWRQSCRSCNAQTAHLSSEVTLLASSEEIWRQPIEYQEGQGATDMDTYYSSSECGGDDDWVFHETYTYYGQDPDGLRWWTTSSRVYWAYLACYGLTLNGFAYNWSEVRLCAGKTCTTMAGGPDWVRDHMYVKHK